MSDAPHYTAAGRGVKLFQFAFKFFRVVCATGAEVVMATNFVTVLAIAAMAAGIGNAGQASSQTVAVCLLGFDGNDDVFIAKQVTDRIFARAGVRVEWRRTVCTPEALRITAEWDTRSRQPAALARAFPYEGNRIDVFANRIVMIDRPTRPFLLGYVLAHEITHVLQGVATHSEKGVMKAVWGFNDYSDMRRMTLSLTDLDVRLIHACLKYRNQRLNPTNGGRKTLE